MPRRQAVTVKYGSGHSKYRLRGFLLVDVPTGCGIINVRDYYASYTRLRRIINLDYLKILLKNYRAFPVIRVIFFL